MASNRVNFSMPYRLANEFLAFSNGISSFPFAIKDTIRQNYDLQCCSYDKAAVKFHIDITIFGSQSAILIENSGQNIIFYNQDEQIQRIRFSIAHELGHYLLGHKMNLAKNDPLYGRQEIEAGFFAAQLLMPEQIIRECIKRGQKADLKFLITNFGVSQEAAAKRLNTFANNNIEYRTYAETKYDNILLAKYSDYINRIVLKD